MKRIASILLALLLCVSLLSVAALAEEPAPAEGEGPAETEPETPAGGSGEAEGADEIIAETAEETLESVSAPAAMAFAGTAAITVSADRTTAAAGDTVTFTIGVSGAEGSAAGGLQFDVVVPEGLEVTSSAVSCAGADMFSMANYNQAAANFLGTGTATLDGINKASWTVMTLTCAVKADAAPGDKTVTLSNVAMWDASLDMNDIATTVSPATVTVQLAPHDHAWDEGRITTEATCTEEGVKTYTCSVCGETRTEPIPAGHVWDAGVVTKEAACTEDGEKTFTCTVCGEVRTEPIPAGHVWDAGVVTKEATASEEGERLYTCAVCGMTMTEAIPALGGGSGAPVTSPKTGDEANIALWAVFMGLCFTGVCCLAAARKKEN